MSTQPYDDTQDHSGLVGGGLGPLFIDQEYLTSLYRNITRAKDLAQKIGHSILSDPEFELLLNTFRSAHESAVNAFQKLRVFEYCKICGNGPKGGCCLREAGLWYDPIALAVNLLLGVRIELNPDPSSCPFLGKKGCILLYRNEFCINFFCEDLQRSVGKEGIRYLRTMGGREIWAGLRLEEYLKKRLF